MNKLSWISKKDHRLAAANNLPVWADIMLRDIEVIKNILRETNPDSYPAINRSALKIAEIVDVYVGEGLEGFSEPVDPTRC